MLAAGCCAARIDAPVALRTRTVAAPTCADEVRPGLAVVQVPSAAMSDWRARLEASGAEIHGYIPENAYLVRLSADALERVRRDMPRCRIEQYLPSDKYDVPVSDGEREYLVVAFGAAERAAAAGRMREMDGCRVIHEAGEIVRARMTRAALETVAAWDEVVWIDLSVVNVSRPMSDLAVCAESMDVASVWPSAPGAPGLTGRGQVVAVADSGLDTGDFGTLHEDLRGRVTRAYDIGRPGDWSDPIAHGTHICGSVAGNGARSGGKIRGPAYEASLIVQSLCDENGQEARPTDLTELFKQAYADEGGFPGAKIHCDSWGAGREEGSDGAVLLGSYVEDCRVIDSFTFEHPDFLVVIASGNDAADLDGDGEVDLDSLNSQATAKNALAVGGVENLRPVGRSYGQISPERFPSEPIFSDDIGSPMHEGVRDMAAFSGRGPCDDGRVKPDVVAPATMVLAAKSSVAKRGGDSPYHYKNGTSMAAPLVAGAAALVRQWLSEAKGVANPDAATVKALLAAGARSVTAGSVPNIPGSVPNSAGSVPNSVEGWGMVDVARSVGADGARVEVRDGEAIAEGETRRFEMRAARGGELCVVMAYADAPAEMAAARQLVNDLDLTVRTPSGKILHPNSLQGADSLNNVEGVRVSATEEGTYVVEVTARSLPEPMPPELVGGRRAAVRFSVVGIASDRIHQAQDMI